MLECLVIGDSIATGFAPHLHCDVSAKVGISAAGWLKHRAGVLHDPRQTLVISLGANDWGVNNYAYLLAIRKTAHAKQVIWVLPANANQSRFNIRQIAEQFGDHVIDICGVSMANTVHPSGTGYQAIASKIESLM